MVGLLCGAGTETLTFVTGISGKFCLQAEKKNKVSGVHPENKKK